MKPQDKHLQTRVEYLVKLLKQAAVEDKAEQLRKVFVPSLSQTTGQDQEKADR